MGNKAVAPYMVGMATLDFEMEVLRRVMLGELSAPVLDDHGHAPLTCLKETDTLGKMLDHLALIGGRSNLYIERADGGIATLAVSEVVPGTNGIVQQGGDNGCV